MAHFCRMSITILSCLVISTRGNTLANTTYHLFTWDSQEWQTYGRGTKTYDANGRLEGLTVEDSVDGAWNPSLRWKYYYKTNGEIDSIVLERYSDELWKLRSVERYAYSGALLHAVYKDHLSTGGGLIYKMKTEYAYSSDRCTSTVDFFYDSGDWLPTDMVVNRYAADLVDTAFWYERDSNEWVPTAIEVHEYDTEGLEIENIWIVYDKDSGWARQSRSIKQRDADGNMKERVFQEWVDGAWENRQKTVYFYSWITTSTQSGMVGKSTERTAVEMPLVFDLRGRRISNTRGMATGIYGNAAGAFFHSYTSRIHYSKGRAPHRIRQ